MNIWSSARDEQCCIIQLESIFELDYLYLLKVESFAMRFFSKEYLLSEIWICGTNSPTKWFFTKNTARISARSFFYEKIFFLEFAAQTFGKILINFIVQIKHPSYRCSRVMNNRRLSKNEKKTPPKFVNRKDSDKLREKVRKFKVSIMLSGKIILYNRLRLRKYKSLILTHLFVKYH